MSASWAEPPALRPDAELDAETLLRALIDHEARFVVIGGFAVAFHGYVRATKDVDIVPQPDAANRERLYQALAELDAEPVEVGDFRPEELPVPFGVEGLAGGGNWALQTRAGRIDVLQSVAGIDSFEDLQARAIDADIPNVGHVLFAGYEDLIAMKRAADRGIDRQDIEALEATRS